VIIAEIIRYAQPVIYHRLYKFCNIRKKPDVFIRVYDPEPDESPEFKYFKMMMEKPRGVKL